MCIKNTAERYGLVAQAFHWIMAVLMIGMLAFGLYLAEAELERGPLMFKLYGLHKSIGVLILGLVLLRIVWRFMNVTPAALPTHKRWEVILSKAVHGFLYLGMIGLPLSGWVMSSAGGHPVEFFGLFELPAIVEKSKALGKEAHEAHEILGSVVIGLIVLHFAGALKHKIIDKDSTIMKMLPFGAPSSKES